RPTDLGGRDAGRDLELGDGVRVREDADGAELRLVVVNAVERKVVVGRALPVDGERAAAGAREARGRGVAARVRAAGAAVAGARVAVVELARVGPRAADARVGRAGHAGRERRQFGEVAAREREFGHLTSRDDCRALARLGLHERGLARHRDNVADLAGLEHDVERLRAADAQLHFVPLLRLEARGRDLDRVEADVE